MVENGASTTCGASIPPTCAIDPTRRRVYYAFPPPRAELHTRSVTRSPFPLYNRETNKTQQTEPENPCGLGALTDVHTGG